MVLKNGLDFTNRCMDAMVKIANDSKTFARDAFWPSEASAQKKDGTVCGKCLRQIQYSYTGLPRDPFDAHIHMVLSIGKSIEEILQQDFDKMGWLVKPNVKIRGEINGVKVSGEIDAVIDIDGETFAVEFKTFHGMFPYKECIENGHGKHEHHLQIMMYLYLLMEQQWELGEVISQRTGEIQPAFLEWQGIPGHQVVINKCLLGYLDRGVTSPHIKKQVNNESIRKPFFMFHIAELRAMPDDDYELYIENEATGITIKSITDRFKRVKKAINSGTIVARDYIPKRPDAELREMYEEYKEVVKAKKAAGKKVSQKMLKTFSRENYADWQCKYCSYRDRCLTDS